MNETGLRVQEKVLTFFIRRYAMLVIAMGLSLTALSLDAIQAHDGNGLYDDFSSGELDRTLWDMSQAGDTAKLTEIDGNNALHITGEQNDYVSIGFKDTEVNNATVFEAKIRIADFGTRDGVISFNLMSENPGHASGYSALMSARGGFLAERNGSFEGLPSSQSTPFSLKKDQWHTVRFELENKELTLTVDGTVVHVAEVEGNQSGKPVFIIDRGMEVFIDDVHVGHPSDETVVLAPTSTPEVVGTPEHTPTPELLVIGTLTITTGPANIRSGASRTGDLLLSAQAGQEFQVVGVIEDGERIEGNTVWYEVVLPENQEAGVLPTATPTPTPTPSPTPDESPRRNQPTSRRGFVSATVVQFRPVNEVTATPTETPTALPTATAQPTIERTVVAENSTPTPSEVTTGQTPEGVAVAMLTGNPNDKLVMGFEMEDYSRSVRFMDYYGEVELSATANWSTMDSFRGVGGERVGAGIYTNIENFPIDPQLFERAIYINGAEMELGLAVGQVLAIRPTYGDIPNILVYVGVPIEGTTRASVFSFELNVGNSRLLAIDNQGSYVGPTLGSDENGYLPRGANPNSSFLWENGENNPVTFRAGTDQEAQISVGSPVGVFFSMNPDDLGGLTARGTIGGSDNRRPEEWISDWRNNVPRDDGRVTVFQLGVVVPANSASTSAP